MNIDINALAAQAETAEPIQSRSRTDYQTEGFTPYAIWKLIGEVLDNLGRPELKGPSQELYNYSKQGRINGRKPEADKPRYTQDEVEKFIPRFVASKIKNAAK